MNTRDVDRLLATYFDLDAPAREPDGLLERVLETTSRRRPAPGWLAQLRGMPMSANAGRVGLFTTRNLALLFALFALLVALVVVAVAGGLISSPPAVVEQPAPTAAPSVAATAGTGGALTFEATDFRMTYPDSPDWLPEEETDAVISLTNRPMGIGVTLGVLEAAVSPDSEFVSAGVVEVDRSVGTSIPEYLAWLRKHPKIEASKPLDTTFQGRPAKQVDLRLKARNLDRLGYAYFGEDANAARVNRIEDNRVLLFELAGKTALVVIYPGDKGLDAAQQIVNEFFRNTRIEETDG